MRPTIKYMLIAWAIVLAVCIVVFLIGVAADNEETAITGLSAVIGTCIVFAVISFGMFMEYRGKHAPRGTDPGGDPIYQPDHLPEADRGAVPVGTDAPLVEELRRSLELA